MTKKPPARKAAKKRAVRPPFGTQAKTRSAGLNLGPALPNPMLDASRPPFGTQTVDTAPYPGPLRPGPTPPSPWPPTRPPFGAAKGKRSGSKI